MSDAGILVYMPGDGQAAGRRRLVWVDRAGQASPIAAQPRSLTYPRISPDGTRVAVESRDQEEDVWVSGTMMSVSVTLTATFAHQLPQPLFDASPCESGIGRNFDVAADGRFLMILDEALGDGVEQPELIVVLNWLEEVKARVKPR